MLPYSLFCLSSIFEKENWQVFDGRGVCVAKSRVRMVDLRELCVCFLLRVCFARCVVRCLWCWVYATATLIKGGLSSSFLQLLLLLHPLSSCCLRYPCFLLLLPLPPLLPLLMVSPLAALIKVGILNVTHSRGAGRDVRLMRYAHAGEFSQAARCFFVAIFRSIRQKWRRGRLILRGEMGGWM